MYRKYVTSRIKEFKARVQEEAGKVLRTLDEEDKRIFEKYWSKPKRSVTLWSDVVKGY